MNRERTTNLLLFFIAAFIIVLILKLAQPVVLVLLLAVLLAYIMDPIMMALKRLGLPLPLAVFITALLFLGIFTGAGTIIISNLISFGRKLPLYQDELATWLNSLNAQIEELIGERVHYSLLDEIAKLRIGNIVINTASTIASNLSFLLLTILFASLFLVEKYHLTRKLVKAFSTRGTGGQRSAREKSMVPIILRHIDSNLRKFLVVRTLISLTVGTASGAVLFFFNIEFAFIWGLLTFLLNYIPNVGSLISMLLPFVFSFVRYGGTATPFLILLSLALCQFVTGVLMEPKFLGDTLNLTLFVVFLSMFFWGWLWGAAGVLLAVPMTTSIKIILSNIPATARYTIFLEKPVSRQVLQKIRELAKKKDSAEKKQ
jgi:predicted PurR-regulated permease PerM